MNKKALVTFVVAGSIFTAPLFAANFLHKLRLDKLPVHAATKSTANKPGQNHTDFSGS